MAVTSFPAASSGGKTQIVKYITSTQSWTAPAGVTSVEVIMAGGGGGGNGAPNTATGGSGGGGSVDYNVLTVSPGTAYTITIGAGGAATTSQTANNGNASSFGALWTVAGGNASTSYVSSTGSGYTSTIGGRIFAPGIGLGGASSWFTNMSTTPAGLWANAQPGAFGIGGGGSGAFDNGSWYLAFAATNGGGTGAARATGSNGYANSGGGGGSVGLFGANGTFSGGSGGSGVCILKYWA